MKDNIILLMHSEVYTYTCIQICHEFLDLQMRTLNCLALRLHQSNLIHREVIQESQKCKLRRQIKALCMGPSNFLLLTFFFRSLQIYNSTIFII